ncbi:MAG TPA: phasin family protein [Stellaceae bacterium]|jgi:hypothetical protein
MPKEAAAPSHAASPARQPGLSYAEFVDFGRDTIASAIDSNAALSTGLEAIGKEVALYARTSFESAGETARGLLGARTFEDVVRLQTDFAERNFDGLIERTAKLSELGLALFGAAVGAWTGRTKTFSA